MRRQRFLALVTLLSLVLSMLGPVSAPAARAQLPSPAADPAPVLTAQPVSVTPSADDRPDQVIPPDAGEVVEMRTATSATYDLGDGRLALVADVTPLHYRDAEGRWQRIDPVFAEAESGWMNRSNAVETSVAATRSDAKLSAGKVMVGWQTESLSVVGAQGQAATLAQPQAGGARGALSADRQNVTFTANWTDPGLVDGWASRPGGAEYTLRLAALPAAPGGGLPDAPQYLELSAALHLVPGMTLQAGEEVLDMAALPFETGGALAFAASEGDPLWLEPPALYEEADPHARAAGSYRLEATADPSVLALHVRVPWAWLAEPGRQFPVILDPVFQVRYPTTARTAIYNLDGSFRAYATPGRLEVGNFHGAFVRTLMLFALPTLPPFVDQTQTKAYLVAAPNEINFTNRNYLTAELKAHELTDRAWLLATTEGPHIGANALSSSNSVLGYTRGQQGFGHVTWDVTGQVLNWYKPSPGTTLNNGLLLRTANEICKPDPNGCGGFYIPNPAQFTQADLDGLQQYYEGKAAKPTLFEGGGIRLIVIYRGPTLTVGQPVPGDNPLVKNFGNPNPDDSLFYNADHEYNLNSGSQWRAVVTRGLGTRYGPDAPVPGQPIGINLQGNTPLHLFNTSDNRLRPAEDAQEGSEWAVNNHLSIVLFNGWERPGEAFRVRAMPQVAPPAPDKLPVTYDIRLVQEQSQIINVDVGSSVALEVPELLQQAAPRALEHQPAGEQQQPGGRPGRRIQQCGV